MKIKKYFLLIVIMSAFNAVNAQIPIYKNKNAPVEARVKDLINRMTLEEKILQLVQNTTGDNTNPNNYGEVKSSNPASIGSLMYSDGNPEVRNRIQKEAVENSRLGIPIIFAHDVIHGFSTIYPISLAQACSWNPKLVTSACAVAAKEARLSGIDWTFSPMIDVARDPRWGRVAEGYGEDPYTNAVFGVASVKGYQGEKLSDPYSIASCLKHYVGYGASEGGRDYRYSEISVQALWETYLPPFEACIKAGAATVMSGFNDISGVPASANYYTLTEILKKRWKHDGFVVSDWASVMKLINQGVAKDSAEACIKAFSSGVEVDMGDKVYLKFLKNAIKNNKVSISSINDAVSRVLRIKFRLGLFENPYTPVVNESERYLQPESKQIAQQLAEESMVLLKNNNMVLPIKPSISSIALIGPLAKSKIDLLGSWSCKGNKINVESIYEGIVKEFGEKKINYALGCDYDKNNDDGFAEALSVAQKSDIIILCLGERKNWSGENASRSSIALPTIQEKLVEKLKQKGKPIILVLSNGRPLELCRLEPLADAIIEIWQPGVAGGTPLAGILSGKINPSGKLAMTFPFTTGQIPIYYDMRQSVSIQNPNPGFSGNYQDISVNPMYWFGHGLSYTSYSYGPVKLSSTVIKKNEKLIASIDVTNTGNMDGKETVHWFISDPVCTISRPMKELKFFEKKEVKKGETITYTFEIVPDRDLSFVDPDGKKVVEKGDFYLCVKDQKIHFVLDD